MKKIIIATIAVFCGVSSTYSQDGSGAPLGSKVMSVEEANRLNGVAQPIINGIPYSQYKAQQVALKQQNAAAAANKQVVSNTISEKSMTVNDNATPAKSTAPAVKVPDVSAHQTSVDNSAPSENYKPDAAKKDIIAPVKEKPVVTQPVTTPLNLNSTSVRGVTEVPVVEKPVKKD